MLTAAVLGFQFARSRETPRDAPMVKSMIVPPDGLSGAPALRLQISPDGRTLAFVALGDSGRAMLWVRQLDSVTAQPLAGTTNAAAPFWSLTAAGSPSLRMASSRKSRRPAASSLTYAMRPRPLPAGGTRTMSSCSADRAGGPASPHHPILTAGLTAFSVQCRRAG
jgi:hypothetical protein